MVKGLEKFRDQFSDLKQCYVLIGGTACDLWMSERERQFRATEDLDIVLIVDELSPEFHERFWSFIQEGQYATHQQSEERPRFYRFEKPAHPDHPKRIELLSRGDLDSPEGMHLAPIRSGEDLSSLSAILLDGVYYQYILDCRTEIEGVPTVPAECLIPLKVRAFLDLRERRTQGDESIRGGDIRKHRNDVFRLYLTLVPADRYDVPGPLKDDLRAFFDALPPTSDAWDAIRRAVNSPDLPQPADIIEQLETSFQTS